MKYVIAMDDPFYREKGFKVHKIVGELHKTNKMSKPYRHSARRIWQDEAGQMWVCIEGKWWKYPEEIET